MTKKILIVSHSNDLHVDVLCSILHKKNYLYFRLNLDCFPRDYHLLQFFINDTYTCEIKHLPSGNCLDLTEVGATWLRKPAEYVFLSDDLSTQERAYAKQETEQTLFGMLYCMNCFWLNHPLALRGAIWKSEQLQRAQGIGFRIPPSLITNIPDQVHSFQETIQQEMIFKSLSTPTLAADDVEHESRISNGIGTTIITRENACEIDAVRELACHFQEYIPKLYELRVTIIGEQLFAAKIYSQDDVRTAVDSRDMSAPIRYEVTQLPQAIEQRCLAFVKSYGLNFGALDLIVTPDDKYVFLENNPNGQFLYVQQLIPEFKLMETLADLLIQEAQCRNQ